MTPMRSMIRRAGAAVAVAMVLAGCQSAAPLMRKAEDYTQIVVAKARTRGETNLADGSAVARELHCNTPGAAPAKLESSRVLPERPRAGREINHRLVIASCPLSGDDPPGTLTRRFTREGRTLFEDQTPYTLKPGRWSVDVFVGIPPQAPPGPYRLEVKFVRRGLQLESASDFVVQP
ncbi:MAG: hypothetical protein U1E89_10635 [Burkholderiaceae bacterium]